jgi:hypothetical protein
LPNSVNNATTKCLCGAFVIDRNFQETVVRVANDSSSPSTRDEGGHQGVDGLAAECARFSSDLYAAARKEDNSVGADYMRQWTAPPPPPDMLHLRRDGGGGHRARLHQGGDLNARNVMADEAARTQGVVEGRTKNAREFCSCI